MFFFQSVEEDCFGSVSRANSGHLKEGCEVEAILPVTMEQLMEACDRMGIDKAPDPDEFSNVALKAAI